jgi:hypothetical protein
MQVDIQQAANTGAAEIDYLKKKMIGEANLGIVKQVP